MAKNPPKDKDVDTDDERPKAVKELAKVHEEALKRYKRCAEDPQEQENRRLYKEDMQFMFIPGTQWLQTIKDERGLDRPCYEFNEIRVKGMSVINHIRANRPAAKIRGVEEGDKKLAEVRQGLYLNITNNSDFDSIKDYAAGHQVGGGFAFWRVDTKYSTDTAFDQDIVISSIMNPLCVYADCSDKDELKKNAKYWFVHSKLENEEFDAKYPEADRVSFEPDEELDPNDDDDSTWVAEYWKKVPIVKNVCLLSTGESIDKDEEAKKQGVPVAQYQLPEGVTVLKERKVKTFKIVQYIISGEAVLEGPNDWAGPDFPFVPVYGYYLVIDGKVYWGGLTRYGKDPQRALNWSLTSVYETIGNAPQAKYWATPEMAKGNVTQWAEANRKNLPAMLANVDPQMPGRFPERMGGAEVPVALINAAGMARDGLKSALGIFDASLGQVSNETSGKAIRARQDEGMVATFNFGDNMAKSERRTCEIVNGLMGKIYDTKRAIRVLGKDGAEQYMEINAKDPVTGEIINDMSKGKFDFVVTTGPSYATQRMEAAEFYGQMSAGNPQLFGAAGDLIVKAQDYPMADAIAERLKLTLPPQIQQALANEGKQSPEVIAAMQMVEQLQQQVAMGAEQVAQASQEAKAEKGVADKAKSDNQIAIANLRTEEAKFAKDVADFKTFIAETKLKMAGEQQTQGENNEREQLSGQLEQALGRIQQEAASLISGFATELMKMQSAQQPQVVVQDRPRVKHIERQNGRLVPVYEDQAQGAVQ